MAIEELENPTQRLNELSSHSFWAETDFWIFIILATSGLVFSFLAFLEAKKAKNAAMEAGRSVKVQTVTIELTELSYRLDKLDMEITYNEARDFLNELTRKLRRLISPFAKDKTLSDPIDNLKIALDSAKGSLASVRPREGADEEVAQNVVYYAIENDFSTISGLVADLMGLFEKDTLNYYGDNDND